MRTTILLATLTGLLVGLGYLIGGPSTALMFLFIGLALNLVMFWFSDKIALQDEPGKAAVRGGGAAPAPDGARAGPLGGHADAAPLHDSRQPAERLRDGPQPQALGRRRHARASRSCSARPSCAA